MFAFFSNRLGVHRVLDCFRGRLARLDFYSTQLWSFVNRHYGRTPSDAQVLDAIIIGADQLG